MFDNLTDSMKEIVYNAQNQAQTPIVPPQYFVPGLAQQAPAIINQNPQNIIAPAPNMMPDSVIPNTQTPQAAATQAPTQAPAQEATDNQTNNIPSIDTEA